MITLRDYQRACLDALYAWFIENQAGNPLLVLPTGAGKAIILAALIREALETWPQTRILMLTHVRELIAQNAQKLVTLWPEAPLGIYSAGLKRRDAFEQVIFAGIQSIHDKAMHLGHFDLILIDECHLVSHQAQGTYRRFLADAQRINPRLRIVGLSATPFRTGHGALTHGEEALFHGVAYQVGMLDLIAQGYLSPLVTKATVTQLDISQVAIKHGEFAPGQLERAVNVAEVTEAALNEVEQYGTDRRRWLLFCTGVRHAEDVATALNARGIKTGCVTGQTPPKQRDALIAQYRSGHLRALTSMGVLTTGFDAPETDLLACLRPTCSPGLWVQMCLDDKTEILTRNGWAKAGEISIGEEVAALDIESGAGSWSRVVDTVDRLTEKSEFFIGASTPRLDIRVTDRHEMIVSTRMFNGGHSKWKKIESSDLLNKRQGFRIPSAVNIDFPGVPISDDDLRFIGLFMTDGTLDPSNGAITIYQSDRYPRVIEMIIATLDGCGMKYKRTTKTGDLCFGKERTCAINMFQISKGAPRATDRHLRGWGYLEGFLSKDLHESLMNCSRRQLDVLLDAINAGDGAKSDKITWVRRSYSISTANKTYANRLQSLCVTRGLSANISENHLGRKRPIILIYISKFQFRTVGGSNQTDRPRMSAEIPLSQERVWCVKTEHGTIVTRRNGKVAVVGNCGRAMRTAPGKTDALILDFAGNTLRHGPVDQIEAWTPRPKEGGEAPAKTCPACQTIVATAVRQCPTCGFEFPFEEKPKHAAQASAAPILSSDTAPRLETHAVSDVFYHLHPGKFGGPPTLRADYYDRYLRVASEWVCFSHEGYSRIKAVAWWAKRAPWTPIPKTTNEAYDRRQELTAPSSITIDTRPKYPEIKGYEFH